MRFSRVKQHVLDEFMDTSTPRRLPSAKHSASQQALIFHKNTARWWGHTPSIGCSRLSDAIWDGSVGWLRSQCMTARPAQGFDVRAPLRAADAQPAGCLHRLQRMQVAERVYIGVRIRV